MIGSMKDRMALAMIEADERDGGSSPAARWSNIACRRSDILA
ncbi:hypothetical protein BRPE64_CCDS07730 [Caballeronia insecticola]|uniref:Uncharacterized protein n=1 Tax=Caballeronia insecticola TaxID=758793 RepID=R4X2P9_9BURK|nr:hypothetical protein BRPE64_CCDS07730 [Caballeronia insecticola]